MVKEQTTLVNPQTTKGLEQTTLDTKQLIAEYLDVVLKTRSTKTHKTYKSGLGDLRPPCPECTAHYRNIYQFPDQK